MSQERTQSAGHSVQHTGALARVGRWCANHPWRTVLVWLVAAVGIVGASATVGGTLVDRFSLPDSDAQRAVDLLQERFPQRAGDSATLVFQSGQGSLKEGTAREVVDAALAKAATVPGVTSVGKPFDGESGALSDDETIAYADVQFDEQAFEVPKADVEELQTSLREIVNRSGAARVEFTGQVIEAQQVPETGTSEILGLLAAMVILIIVFGTFVAMGIPILLALLSVGLGLSLLLLAARLTDFNTITPTLATMIGLGVGIDYSLFIVTRFRQALHDGLPPREAAAVAAATAGRAVIFAGLTVAISISALAVVGLDFVTKLGLGAAITVVLAVLAATTLLPAILSLLGHRIDRGKVPFVKVADDSHEARQDAFFTRWARWVTRHARPIVAVTVLGLGALMLPALGWVHLGASDAGSAPTSQTTRQAYDLLAEGFGKGFNGPLLIAVDQSKNPRAADMIVVALRQDPGVASVAPPIVNDAGDTAQIVAFPKTAPDSEETRDLVERLRGDQTSALLDQIQARAFVGGPTAAFEDIATRIYSRFPLFLLVAVGITFLMLTMAFRSVVIAIKASITTVMSALAAAGILVMVFQFGWGISLIGLDRTGPVESFLPVIVFAILFGLSMDYEVFLVSRIREEYVHGDAARPAIIDGVGAIGRVVAAAAAIMAVVFFAFILGSDRVIKEFGVALGFAIVIDAYIVRLMLVPAIMHLLNEKAWYMPKWLDRVLPRITIESPTQAPEADGLRPAEATK